ncbi:hypothetical protein B0A48_04093 [Cryoendolithus antarcticus]|uniref:Oxidoreductase-like domain-containing protein n=1 Tax=Cryoendolithus antarcticus TaxID=1507870 RepID=A0A1V8THC9_9PEZI|nr:hypothetical protein B0A48_04093 [Cryoendolithus antarcticus]
MEVTSSAGFVDLPEELCELVATQLDFGDLCSLRLSAREIAAKVWRGCFKSRFIKATLKLSYASCQSFAAVTEPGGPSCMLENLTILGLPDLPDQDRVLLEADGPGMTAHLAQALSNLRVHSKIGVLRSLILSVQDAVTRDYHDHVAMYSKDQIRACAISTERIVAQALKISALPIESVNFYGSMSRCAMSFSRFQEFQSVLENSTSTLKSLALVLTSDVEHELTEPRFGISSRVSGFLAHLPQLQSLDLRWYNARRDDLTGADPVDRLFFTSVASLSIPMLKDLSLRGIYTTWTDLLRFLRRHTGGIKNLCLENVKLVDGTFDAIFTHISDRLELDSLSLRGLRGEAPGAIQFAQATPISLLPESVVDPDKEDRIAKARVVFGSRLASPVERWDAIKRASTNIAGVLVPPRPEEPDNCCMSGCVNCVWDLFRDELEEWAAKKAEAREKLAALKATEAAVSMDDDGGGSNTNWEIDGKDSGKADLFEGIPVGIRAFMETEKRLKMLQKQQEQVHGGQ